MVGHFDIAATRPQEKKDTSGEEHEQALLVIFSTHDTTCLVGSAQFRSLKRAVGKQSFQAMPKKPPEHPRAQRRGMNSLSVAEALALAVVASPLPGREKKDTCGASSASIVRCNVLHSD